MRILGCFFVLIFVAGVISCTGDDETIIETVVERQVQCHNGELVDDIADCSPRPQQPQEPQEPQEPQQPGADSGECNLNAAGKAPFNGSSANDVICGDDDNNTINALQGEDVVRAGGGNDIVDGGSGNDELYGEAGNDTLTGGEDEDLLDGGAGDDTLIGNEGRDEFKGGDGSDTARYLGHGDDAAVGVTFTINLAHGYSNDEYGDQDEYDSIENIEIAPGVSGTVYTITGDANANRLTGGAGDDTINGGGGNDIIDGMGGTNALDGGEGSDTLVVGVTTILGTGNSGFEHLQARAGAGDLDLTGDTENNDLTGNEGANVLAGGRGNDRLVGGGGTDTLRGGLGRNTFTGGADADCFEIMVDDSVDTVTDFSTAAGDTIHVTGTLPIATESGGAVAATARNGNIAAIETYTPDGGTETTKSLGTLATVRGLTAGTAVGSGC